MSEMRTLHAIAPNARIDARPKTTGFAGAPRSADVVISITGTTPIGVGTPSRRPT